MHKITEAIIAASAAAGGYALWRRTFPSDYERLLQALPPEDRARLIVLRAAAIQAQREERAKGPSFLSGIVLIAVSFGALGMIPATGAIGSIITGSAIVAGFFFLVGRATYLVWKDPLILTPTPYGKAKGLI